MFVEDYRFHVGLIDHHIDDREFGVGKIRGDLCQHVAKGKAGHHDRVRSGFGQTAQRLFAHRLGGHFQFLVGAAGFRRPFLGAVEGGFVEGFVELAAKVENQCGVGQRRAGTQRQRCCGPHQMFYKRH